ncbi:hypothetical protein C5167_025968 [Papaver somniferum]|uniref:RRM domain-containing protein n=1 Tax=Papaver somniferum TaxID=3469 RepID=A0A4Y7JSY3_PAPSO|nr:hypothetical protein C5167_025968 [Papaver somniferum]
MRPVFCGSFDYETRQSDLERLFSKFGTVFRVDMKSGIVPNAVIGRDLVVNELIKSSRERYLFVPSGAGAVAS